jgi:hypothetical protein
MGGVVLPSGGSASAANVAYRAVPGAPGGSSSLSVPIGLIAIAKNPPVLNPDDPEFNIYELANTLYNPPWNLQLVSPDPPSNDIVLEVGRNHLSIQLGDVGRYFPADHSKLGTIAQTPPLGFGFRGFFTGASAIVQFQNDLMLNQPLHAALAEGAPFLPNTQYAIFDDADGQAAAVLQLGWAGALRKTENPRGPGGFGLYTGLRAKALRGLVYGDAENVVSFNTNDTLFSTQPIDIGYNGTIRKADPSGGGWGHGLDVGAVMIAGGFELGLGVNDVVSKLDWKVEESITYRDSVQGDIVKQIVRTDAPFTSSFPQTVTANTAFHLGNALIAADVVRTMDNTLAHAGMEMWFGPLAVRGGTSVDANKDLQYAGGLGVRLGRLGVDTGVTTHNRNLTRERAVELGLGLSLYH